MVSELKQGKKGYETCRNKLDVQLGPQKGEKKCITVTETIGHAITK